MLEQVLVLTYRDADGNFRVQPTDHIWSYRRNAVAEAKMVAKHHGLTIRVLDFGPEIASYEPGGERFNWRDNGWYCQHSYEFCTPCFAGYDHPDDVIADMSEYQQGPSI